MSKDVNWIEVRTNFHSRNLTFCLGLHNCRPFCCTFFQYNQGPSIELNLYWFYEYLPPCRDVKNRAVWLKKAKPHWKISERRPTQECRTLFPLILPYFFFNTIDRDRIKGLTPREYNLQRVSPSNALPWTILKNSRDEKRNLRFPCVQWKRKRNFVSVSTVYKGNANFVFRPWKIVTKTLNFHRDAIRGHPHMMSQF